MSLFRLLADYHWKLRWVTLLPGYLHIMPVCDYYCPVAQITNGYWLIAIGNCSGLPCYPVTCFLLATEDGKAEMYNVGSPGYQVP